MFTHSNTSLHPSHQYKNEGCCCVHNIKNMHFLVSDFCATTTDMLFFSLHILCPLFSDSIQTSVSILVYCTRYMNGEFTCKVKLRTKWNKTFLVNDSLFHKETSLRLIMENRSYRTFDWMKHHMLWIWYHFHIKAEAKNCTKLP